MWVSVAWVACALALHAQPLAASSRSERAPRLVVPGSSVLHADERIDLRWHGGGRNVEEMEILLTTDGPNGRTVRISPQLDPRRGVFVWRVPDLGGATSARLSVRFNCDGHEIEGEPTSMLRILSAADPSPPAALLPEAADREAGSSANGRGGDKGSSAGSGESEAGREIHQLLRAASQSHSPTSGELAGSSAPPNSRQFSIPPFVPTRN